MTKTDVDTAAQQVAHNYREQVDGLWNDLPTETQLDVLDLSITHEIARAGRSADRIEVLTQRGLATEAGGNKLKSACRLMEQHASQHGQSLPEVKKLFSTSPEYERNILEVLQLRLAQAKGLNAELEHHVEDLIKVLPKPETAKELLRGVADRCLHLILAFEFRDGTINSTWVSEWKAAYKLTEGDDRNRDILNCKVPLRRGEGMWLLGLLHDEDIAGTAKTRRSTYHLLEALYSAASFSQHAREIGEKVPNTFITAMCFVAVELLHQLREDTSTKT